MGCGIILCTYEQLLAAFVFGDGQLLRSCLLHDLYVPETAFLNSSKKNGLESIFVQKLKKVATKAATGETAVLGYEQEKRFEIRPYGLSSLQCCE